MSHYETLGVPRDASTNDIKDAYRAAVLKHHPDKLAGADCGNGAEASLADSADFKRVQQAWEVLRDPSQRAAYDSGLTLAALRATVAFQDELTLDEMDAETEEGEDVYTYPCRCGDSYRLRKVDANEHPDIAVQCRTCSNQVLVKTT
ncbi:hypothetical protein HYH03_016966 [Edaphochlamys debaryana]|uniref:Diphthamide biosynthesis protein 4 n=1 Tax=Edaphochlamys debaryana TaxID=47281 RepID=A0A835XI51_9CHLO|nr:hypothetical protein HYH03_016966 [Edaphochlamys debaryana]|eukprot:KAG2484231.1 hypothetical protein HYH03_016966 [Edaphochlamys debaryana]